MYVMAMMHKMVIHIKAIKIYNTYHGYNTGGVQHRGSAHGGRRPPLAPRRVPLSPFCLARMAGGATGQTPNPSTLV